MKQSNVDLNKKAWYRLLKVIFWILIIFTAYAPFYRGSGSLSADVLNSIIGVIINGAILIGIWKIIYYIICGSKKPDANSKNKINKQNKLYLITPFTIAAILLFIALVLPILYLMRSI